MGERLEQTVWMAELDLVGPSGEPVDLRRTIASHGLVDLPPLLVDRSAGTLEVTLVVDGRGARTLRLEGTRPGTLRVGAIGPPPTAREAKAMLAGARHVLRLDEDLSPFYALAAADPSLAWATAGAGRLIRSSTVFEEVVKTICTTNCAWSATVRMVDALVGGLGAPAPGAPLAGPLGRAFPTPLAMALADDAFYADVVRAGYRGRYLRQLASSVAEGSLDLEGLADRELPEGEVERRLLALPGVGPYAAAHVMMMLGRYSRLVLDSWTRPTYARLTGGRPVKDTVIQRRFRRYGPWAGLAFWLTVTSDWVDEEDG